jgi:Ca-activated chloride channel family protein
MTSRLLISLSLLALAASKAGAQLAPAADFFNSGAQFYISNNVPAALESVENGLKTYPNDEKLKQLEQLLKQQQQQQQQNQQNQQKNQQDQRNQQNQQSQQQKSEDQQKQQEQKQAEKKKEDQKPPSTAREGDDSKQDQKDQEGQPLKAGELTPEEARHLLDAQKDDEQLLHIKPPDKPRNPTHTVKDW